MKSVAICGSRRFESGIRRWTHDLRQRGVVVFDPHLHQPGAEWNELSEDYKKYVLLGLTHDHFHKIRKADVVLLYNEGGYVGVNTTLEIGFAAAMAKPIYALTPDTIERGRDVLIDDYVSSVVELMKRLQ